MATSSRQSLARKTLNEVELRALERLLYTQAEIIDALLVDGIPYTKIYLGGARPDEFPQGGQ